MKLFLENLATSVKLFSALAHHRSVELIVAQPQFDVDAFPQVGSAQTSSGQLSSETFCSLLFSFAELLLSSALQSAALLSSMRIPFLQKASTEKQLSSAQLSLEYFEALSFVPESFSEGSSLSCGTRSDRNPAFAPLRRPRRSPDKTR